MSRHYDQGDFLAELLGTVASILVLALLYTQCPAENCEEAVQNCVLSEGTVCSDISKRCAEKK